jgi:hypothetical protein
MRSPARLHLSVLSPETLQNSLLSSLAQKRSNRRTVSESYSLKATKPWGILNHKRHARCAVPQAPCSLPNSLREARHRFGIEPLDRRGDQTDGVIEVFPVKDARMAMDVSRGHTDHQVGNSSAVEVDRT